LYIRGVTVFSPWSVGWVSTAWEWTEETLCEVEELDKHLATGEGREEIVFVTVNGGCPFVPKVVAVK
jgi:hypothetical protein